MSESTATTSPKTRPPEGFWFLVWGKVREEPAQAAALAYFWLIAVGFAHLFGSGMAFSINIIDLASPADFLVAGLRDPVVTFLAALTGLLLYTLWGRWLDNTRSLSWLAALAGALLILGACLSAAYRHAVVLGVLRTWPGAPQPLTITFKGEEGSGKLVECARIGVVTADFIVLGIDPCAAAGSGRRLIVARSEIKQFDVREQTECACHR
jgi:hypothetical protein